MDVRPLKGREVPLAGVKEEFHLVVDHMPSLSMLWFQSDDFSCIQGNSFFALPS